jgi:hypothetical protein
LVVVFTKCKKKDLTKEIMLEDESKILEDWYYINNNSINE